MSAEIACKQNILVTDSHLLKLLLVVLGFGSQTNVCGFSRQNICSVAKYITDLCPNQVFLGLAHDSTIPKDDFEPTKIYKIKNCLNQGY